MNGSTYLKLASAARDFVKQDDIWQAMEPSAVIEDQYNLAIRSTPEVLAEAAALILGVVRCAAVNALEAPVCTNCKKPKVSWKDQCSCDKNEGHDTETPS